MNYGNVPGPSYSLFGHIPPEAKWWFIAGLVAFIIAIHIHAITRD